MPVNFLTPRYCTRQQPPPAPHPLQSNDQALFTDRQLSSFRSWSRINLRCCRGRRWHFALRAHLGGSTVAQVSPLTVGDPRLRKTPQLASTASASTLTPNAFTKGAASRDTCRKGETGGFWPLNVGRGVSWRVRATR